MSEGYPTSKVTNAPDDATGGQQIAFNGEDSIASSGPDEKRRPGRKPGAKKTGGRKAGTKNIVSTKTKETVQSIFDANGPAAMQRLFNIAFGRRIRVGTGAGPNPEYIYPSESSQMRALETLARKLRPDLASQTLTGPDNTDLFKDIEPEQPRQLARAVVAILSNGAQPTNELQIEGVGGLAGEASSLSPNIPVSKKNNPNADGGPSSVGRVTMMPKCSFDIEANIGDPCECGKHRQSRISRNAKSLTKRNLQERGSPPNRRANMAQNDGVDVCGNCHRILCRSVVDPNGYRAATRDRFVCP